MCANMHPPNGALWRWSASVLARAALTTGCPCDLCAWALCSCNSFKQCLSLGTGTHTQHVQNQGSGTAGGQEGN